MREVSMTADGGIGRAIRSSHRISRCRRRRPTGLSETSKPISRFHGRRSTKASQYLDILEPITSRSPVSASSHPWLAQRGEIVGNSALADYLPVADFQEDNFVEFLHGRAEVEHRADSPRRSRPNRNPESCRGL